MRTVVFVELGAVMLGLAILARAASRWGIPTVSLYLLAGLAFGNGGLVPLKLTTAFIDMSADIGLLLLMFMLGLEYTGEELWSSLRAGWAGGLTDAALNFPVGVIAGVLLGWRLLPALLLGGITYISSTGVIAKVLADPKRANAPETPSILSLLVMEDLAMAIYLPPVMVLLTKAGPARLPLEVMLAISVAALALLVALRYSERISRLIAHESDEVLLLTVMGVVLLVAGFAASVHISAAIGAFLVGIAVSGPVSRQAHQLVAPLRDLFAAIFFLFFGLQIDPAILPPVLPVAIALGVISAITKIASGYLITRRLGPDRGAWLRAGTALMARGEFSIAIAGLGSAIEPRLVPLSAAYVLLLAVLSPILTRRIEVPA